MPDFATMDRKALRTFRENATKRNERPTVENNYLTMKFSMERRSQPADWVSTCIATKWCEHHGPSGHTTDNCEKLAAMKKGEPKKKVQKPKKSMAAYYKQVRILLPVLSTMSLTNS